MDLKQPAVVATHRRHGDRAPARSYFNLIGSLTPIWPGRSSAVPLPGSKHALRTFHLRRSFAKMKEGHSRCRRTPMEFTPSQSPMAKPWCQGLPLRWSATRSHPTDSIELVRRGHYLTGRSLRLLLRQRHPCRCMRLARLNIPRPRALTGGTHRAGNFRAKTPHHPDDSSVGGQLRPKNERPDLLELEHVALPRRGARARQYTATTMSPWMK